MFTPENWEVWLDPESSKDDLFAAVADETPALAWHAVGKDVGNIRNEGPELAEPAAL